MKRVAVNVCDLSDLVAENTLIGPILLQDFVSRPESVIPDRNRLDTGAMVLNGPAAQDEKRLQEFVEMLQLLLGPKKIGRRIRCYEETSRGNWKEIISDRAHLHPPGDDPGEGL